MQVGLPFSFADIAAARDRIASAVERTPAAVSHTLSSITGAEVVIKFENLQFTGSFKERGALNRLLLLTDDERSHGVVAMSDRWHRDAVVSALESSGFLVTTVD